MARKKRKKKKGKKKYKRKGSFRTRLPARTVCRSRNGRFAKSRNCRL